MEQGKDAKEVIQDYFQSLDRIIKLEEKLIEQKKNEEKRLKIAQKKMKQMFEKIKMQQEKIIKPMLVEIKVKDTIIEQLKSDQAKNARDLKLFNAIIRLPRMTMEFQKAMWRREEQDIKRKHETDAIKYLNHQGIKEGE